MHEGRLLEPGFLLYILRELNFPISLKNAKPQNFPPSKISDIKELSLKSDCVTLICVGFLGVRFAIGVGVGKIPPPHLSKSC